MTIQFLQAWNGYQVGAIVSTLPAHVEAALTQTIPPTATFSVNNGFVAPNNAPLSVTQPNYVYFGNWGQRPQPQEVSPTSTMFISDVGANGGTTWRVVNGVWRLAGPQILAVAVPATGIASAGVEQFLSALVLPQSMLSSLRWFEFSYLVNKVGVAGACTVSIREGTTGGALDTPFFGTGVFSAANLGSSNGDVRRWDATAARFTRYSAGQGSPRGAVTVTTIAYPAFGVGALGLANQDIIYSLTLNCAAADVPSVVSFDIVGW